MLDDTADQPAIWFSSGKLLDLAEPKPAIYASSNANISSKVRSTTSREK
jgi:hypothetical protein